MVDSISSSGPFQNAQVQNAQALTPSPKPASAPPASAPAGNTPVTDTTSGAQNVDLSSHINSDLTNDQALSQSQTAGQQLSGTGLSIANRAPQALYNALSG